MIRFYATTMNPARVFNSLRKATLSNKSGEKTDPCLTRISIILYQLNSFSLRRQVISYSLFEYPSKICQEGEAVPKGLYAVLY